MIGFPALFEPIGATIVEGHVLILYHRPAHGKRTAYGREWPRQLKGFLPGFQYSFWGPWGMEALMEYARKEIHWLTEVREWTGLS